MDTGDDTGKTDNDQIRVAYGISRHLPVDTA